MAADWWAIGTAWQAMHAGLAHGDLVRITAEFAKDHAHDSAPNTLRGYKTAVEFLQRLQADKVIDGVGALALARLPLKSIAILQRVGRYGPSELRPLLDLVLALEPATTAQLQAAELEVRARPRPGPALDANAHEFRLRAKSFRSGALAAWADRIETGGGATAFTASPTHIEPFMVDGLAVGIEPDRKLRRSLRPYSNDRYDGIRLLAETAGTTVRPRLAEALLPALAAARAFDAFLLITQASSDADDLAGRIGRIGECGVGVAWYDSDARALDHRIKPKRARRPDLAGRYMATFTAFFPPGSPVPAQREQLQDTPTGGYPNE